MSRASLLTLLAFTVAAPAPARADAVAGLQSRRYPAPEMHTWRGQQDHALSVDVWYPAVAGAVEKPLAFPPEAPTFLFGRAARDAAVAAAPARLPLVIASHGTGGSSMQLAWLASSLARRGYLVAVVNHPGNHAGAPYTTAGFILWWERARDLSIVLDRLLADPVFAPRIDRARIGAAGFSIGGYTVLEVAGARTDRAAFVRFCKAHPGSTLCGDPPEMPGLTKQIDTAMASDSQMQRSLAESSASFKDARVRAVFAIAPAVGPALTALETIAVPVAIVAGSADAQAAPAENARVLAAGIKGAKLEMLPGVGHYTFLGSCSAAARARMPVLCVDGAGVDREAVHAHAAAAAVDFFDRALAP